MVPLVLASGASSSSQRAIGTGVLGGMITGTVLAVFFVPLFFVIVRTLFKSKKHAEDSTAPAAADHNPEALRHD
ncbi:putative efflux pump membrane transporter TtgB [compost metagenome]